MNAQENSVSENAGSEKNVSDQVPPKNENQTENIDSNNSAGINESNQSAESNLSEAFSKDASGSERFRVDNEVVILVNEEKTIINTSTVFIKGAVCDFIGDNGEIIIFDEQKKTYILIDPTRRIQTEATLSQVAEFIDQIKDRLKKSEDPFVQFALSPSFTLTQNQDFGEFLFQSKWIDYDFQTKVFDDEKMSERYYDFCYKYSILNIYLNPGTVTPFARLKTNDTLRQQKSFPEKIKITVYPKGKHFFAKPVVIESQHRLVKRLTVTDENRLVRALHFVEQYQKISFSAYQKKLME